MNWISQFLARRSIDLELSEDCSMEFSAADDWGVDHDERSARRRAAKAEPSAGLQRQ